MKKGGGILPCQARTKLAEALLQGKVGSAVKEVYTETIKIYIDREIGYERKLYSKL